MSLVLEDVKLIKISKHVGKLLYDPIECVARRYALFQSTSGLGFAMSL